MNNNAKDKKKKLVCMYVNERHPMYLAIIKLI